MSRILHHLSLPVSNLKRSAEMYDAALTCLGYRRVAEAPIARDNGSPGPRPHYGDGYYAAFVLDPDGHHLEAVYNPRGEEGKA